jgi:8-hydroxy-5-deazaflavin:NADPH oxidoreductase
VLIDVANPLDSSQGMPPVLSVCNTDSLGEQIQRAFPDARVVKTLNTVNHEVMVNPSLVPGSALFMCGDDDAAKDDVQSLIESFGWPGDAIVDLGDISAARGMEMFLALWLRMYMKFGAGHFNVAVVRG